MTTPMTTRYVTHVESNVKGGVNCVLGPRTLVVGEMGAGKSAIVNAIELALSGRVSDVVGRAEVAKEAELLALAPGRKGPLTATVKLSDGATASFSLGAGRSKKSEHTVPASIDPAFVFPLRAVREAVLGGPDTTRKFFLSLVAGGVKEADVLARITPALHARFKQALVPSKANSAVDKLLDALEEAGAQQRQANATVKATEEAAAQAAQGLPPLPTEEQLKTAKDALAAAQAELERVLTTRARAEQARNAQDNLSVQREHITQVEAELASKRVTLAAANARLQELNVAMANVQAPAPLTEVQRAAAALMLDMGVRANTVDIVPCHACGCSLPAGAAQDRARAASARLEERTKQSRERNTLEERIQRGNAVVGELTMRVGQLEQDLDRTTSFMKAAGAAVVNDGLPADAMGTSRAAVATAEAALKQLEQAHASYSAVQRARESALDAKLNAESWEKLIEECKRTVKELLDAGIGGFVAKVQARVPAGYTFDLRLREGAREVCQHGFVRDGVLHTALSGAEWAIEQAAIASVVAETWAKEGQVFVVVPEDRGLSPKALGTVLAAFASCPAQVIIATPTRPVSLPEGWTMIDADRGENRVRAATAPAA